MSERIDWDALKAQAKRVANVTCWLDEGGFAAAAYQVEIVKLAKLMGFKLVPDEKKSRKGK